MSDHNQDPNHDDATINRPLATQPSVKNSAETPLERLFLYYSQELTKKHEAMMASVDTYKESLVKSGQDTTHIESFRREIKVWGEEIQAGFDQSTTTFGELSSSANDKMKELQIYEKSISDSIEGYKRLLDDSSPTDQDTIQLIKSHHTDIIKLRKDLDDGDEKLRDTIEKRYAELKTELERQIGIEVNARHLREHDVAHARAMLVKRITDLQRYLETGSVPSNKINFHDVYGYLRLGIEHCPAEAMTDDLVNRLNNLRMTIVNRIESAKKTGRKNNAQKQYEYDAPRLAFDRLCEFVRERQKGGR